MTAALIYFACSVAALVLFGGLYVVEDIRGHRVILSGARTTLDQVLQRFAHRLHMSRMVPGSGFVRLVVHYALNSVLKRLLNTLHSLEVRVESLVRRNRSAAKHISAEKGHRTHLDEIADHKNKTALSEAKKRKLRSH